MIYNNVCELINVPLIFVHDINPFHHLPSYFSKMVAVIVIIITIINIRMLCLYVGAWNNTDTDMVVFNDEVFYFDMYLLRNV